MRKAPRAPRSAIDTPVMTPHRGKKGDAVRGPLDFRIVPPLAALSFSELESQFALRRRVDSAGRSEIVDSYAALRQQYTEQSHRAKLQFADPRLQQPCCSTLFHLAVGSVKASRLAYTALREAEFALRSADVDVVSPDVVQRAIDWNRQQLNHLEAQLRLLDLVDGVMLPLRKLVVQLETSRHVSALGWRSIARHLVSESGRLADGAPFFPLPGFSLKAYLSFAGHGPYGDAFSRGIETTLSLAPVLVKRDADSAQTDLLSIAALCQDCGLLLSARHRRPASGRGTETPAGWPAHPSIGAGLVAGMAEFATELPSLVAEHHQRFIGFDRLLALAPAIQKKGSRLLATTVRFLEIVDELPMNAADEVSPPGAALYSAAVQLGREAARGEWDSRIAGELLGSLGFRLEYEPADISDDDRHSDQSAYGNRRLDPGSQAVPDPNFLLAQQVRESRHVRTTRS